MAASCTLSPKRLCVGVWVCGCVGAGVGVNVGVIVGVGGHTCAHTCMRTQIRTSTLYLETACTHVHKIKFGYIIDTIDVDIDLRMYHRNRYRYRYRYTYVDIDIDIDIDLDMRNVSSVKPLRLQDDDIHARTHTEREIAARQA